MIKHGEAANSIISSKLGVYLPVTRWATGLLWIECKQMYSSGIRVYLLDNYNLLDFIVLSLYLASYMLRFLVDRWIKQADRHYNGTELAREALLGFRYADYDRLQGRIFNDSSDSSHSYFMKARTWQWHDVGFYNSVTKYGVNVSLSSSGSS